MTINPLIPFVPAFIQFFVYGWIASLIFSFGRRGGHGCIFTIIFWYAFLVFAIFVWLFVSVQSTFNQFSFLIGAIVPYVRRAWESEAVQQPIAIASDIAHFVRRVFQQSMEIWQTRTQKQNTEAHSQQAEQHQTHANHDEAMRQEQERRESEARERREQAEKERRRQQDNADTRSFEEILGLSPPWTQDDLRSAYKREAGRTHPDKWIGKPEPIQKAMEEEYKRIQEAYRQLKNE